MADHTRNPLSDGERAELLANATLTLAQLADRAQEESIFGAVAECHRQAGELSVALLLRWNDTVEEVTEQRDELLAACKVLWTRLVVQCRPTTEQDRDQLSVAIAKAEGEE